MIPGGPRPVAPFSHAVETDGFVFVTGQMPDSVATPGILPEGIVAQTRAVMENLKVVLAGLGLIDTAAGEYASAERDLAEAREMFRRAGDRWGLASSLWRTADLALRRPGSDLHCGWRSDGRRIGR